ncbi:ATP synthase F0, B subunit [Marvinbryantia formatexigens DSM 14469]|uniref:ATP synthase subunit b n=1 Tax=Marvinbryantia formatexigens DSM 14469 TaxID=478749 RepID=C6LAJ6_9FIRM|nr:ATP synthase F0, B subunit [Marvinbryantia formatexigens DSM 14469]SDG60702.1 F-type H+-transporting ATPase subunit b [Marvinbryantia formatexigens]
MWRRTRSVCIAKRFCERSEQKGGETVERLFNLDPQLLADTVLLMLAMLVMYTLLSYLLFNPARDFLKKRQERIKNDIDTAQADKEQAKLLKEDYDARIKNINKEADEILSQARQKALQNAEDIKAQANEEAARIIARAQAQIELDKKKAADDMKKEMISIASLMAGKVVAASINTEVQESLMEETLKEIGDDTWQS